MGDRLDDYRRKRDFEATPEPGPSPGPSPTSPGASGNRFVVQEHHARRLHWDFRLERDGVLVSWAVPKGIPPDPKVNHLAVPTEDHPLSYIDFAGEIPKGQYGGGQVMIWDHGTYECEKWSDREVMVVLHGERVEGRYVLFKTGDKQWMMHRMSPPQDPTREPMPERVEPMKATLAPSLPRDDDGRWAYEIKWDGYRTIAFIAGGSVRLQSRTLLDTTDQFPEVRRIGPALGSHEVVLDGEIVALDPQGRPDFGLLQQRGRGPRPPLVYMIFDVLYLDGHSTCSLSYEERRRLLDELGLGTGANWQVPASHVGDGDALLAATRQQGLEGLVAKRLDCPYEPGRRVRHWLKVKNTCRQEFVVGGWLPGEAGRAGSIGALLVGYYDEAGALRYAGRVGSGFTEGELRRVGALLDDLAAPQSPFSSDQPLPVEVRRKGHWVRPELVAEVEFREWTHTDTLRAPVYKGTRDDKPPREVVRET